MKPSLSDFILASIQEEDDELFQEIKKIMDERSKAIKENSEKQTDLNSNLE